MDRILFLSAIALFYSSFAVTADDARNANRSQNNLINFHQDRYDEMKPGFWAGKYDQPATVNLPTQGILIEDSPDRSRSYMETYIGPGVSPLFGTYSVFRTSGKQDGSSYVAFGFNFDELIRDEAEASYSSDESDLSVGFGVDNSSFNIEYMIYMNDENYEISAVSLGFNSAF